VIVADVNLVVYLLVDGPFTAAARNTLQKDDQWIAPASWRTEFINVMATNVRAKKFSIDRAIEKLRAADQLVRTVDTPMAEREIIQLSVKSKIATYDCVFVWLARHDSIKVVTRDGDMLDYFKDVAVNLEEFGSSH
jgi:predicted nucleic acid-binding protein